MFYGISSVFSSFGTGIAVCRVSVSLAILDQWTSIFRHDLGLRKGILLSLKKSSIFLVLNQILVLNFIKPTSARLWQTLKPAFDLYNNLCSVEMRKCLQSRISTLPREDLARRQWKEPITTTKWQCYCTSSNNRKYDVERPNTIIS